MGFDLLSRSAEGIRFVCHACLDGQGMANERKMREEREGMVLREVRRLLRSLIGKYVHLF